MILYHFTRPEFLEAILRDGLKVNQSLGNGLANGEPVVWLTARDTLVPSLKARQLFLARGILFGPRSSNLPKATVCLRVVIGSHDRRLVRYLSWLRRHPGSDPDDPLLCENQADDWLYFGDIPPAKLTVFKHVPRTMNYWILEHHERWQADGAEARWEPPGLEDDLLAGRAGPPDYVKAMQEPEKELG